VVWRQLTPAALATSSAHLGQSEHH